jgi:hypothetical protein
VVSDVDVFEVHGGGWRVRLSTTGDIVIARISAPGDAAFVASRERCFLQLLANSQKNALGQGIFSDSPRLILKDLSHIDLRRSSPAFILAAEAVLTRSNPASRTDPHIRRAYV